MKSKKSKNKRTAQKTKKVSRRTAARKPAPKAKPRRTSVRRPAAAVKKPASAKAKALTRIEDYLTDHKVRYEFIRHRKAYTAQELAAVEHVSGKQHVKVVVVAVGGKHVLAALPASSRIDFKKLGQVLGKSVSLAKETVLKSLFPDCDVGAMPPLGSLYRLPVYVDKSLVQNESIVFQAGTHTDAIKVGYANFANLESPKVADFIQLTQIPPAS